MIKVIVIFTIKIIVYILKSSDMLYLFLIYRIISFFKYKKCIYIFKIKILNYLNAG